jgi:SAM (Sterile alpha motif) domain-containing protein
MHEIAEWLGKLGMAEYAQRFVENRIDFSVLPDLTDQDLKDIGVVLGDRRKILRAIARLDAGTETMGLEAVSTLEVAAVQSLPTQDGTSERSDVTLDDIVGESGGGHPRTDYHRLIARAVKGLDGSAEARRLIYERARKALIAHLRFNQPGLSKAVVVKERLALDEAIRNIEAESARKSRPEIPTQPTTAIRSLRARDGDIASELPRRDWPAVRPDPRERPFSGWSAMEEQAVSGFREELREVHDFGAETSAAMQTAPHAGEAYEEETIEPLVDPHDLYWSKLDPPQERDREDADGSEDLPQVRATRGTAPEAERTGRSLSYGALATLLVALIMVLGSAAAVFWEWPAISEFHIFFGHSGGKLQGQQGSQTTSAQAKLAGRVSEDEPGPRVPASQSVATQRAVLYEQTPTDSQGKRYAGSAVWRTEAGPPGPEPATDLAVRADVTIPERSMAVTWTLRRSAHKAAYTIETTFNLPADFPGGGIADVPGILMKRGEQARGTPLSGLAVKVMNGFFVIGLSTDETDAQHNERLLKEFSWLDIPIVYTNGGRAILAIEKGSAGDRAFAQAFAAEEER